MTIRRKWSVFGVLAVAALVLGACRAEEQGRVTNFKPGVYMGKKDTQLSDAQREALRGRSDAQSDRAYISVGGGTAVRKSDIDTGALKARIDGQRVR